MSIIKDQLTALQPGSVVKLTQNSGYSVYGVVTANDGSESLSLSVTTVATLKYDQIAALEVTVSAQAAVPASVPVVTFPVKPAEVTSATEPVTGTSEPAAKKVMVTKVECSAATVSDAFKALKSDEKKHLNPAVNKLTEGIKRHSAEKLKEALAYALKMRNEKKISNANVNNYIANIAVLADDGEKAAECFFLAGRDREAYCCAFHAAEAERENPRRLYLKAATYAAIYIAGDSELEYAAEAAYVLKTASQQCMDISGVKFASYAVSEAKAHSFLIMLLRDLSADAGVELSNITDIPGCCDQLKKAFPLTDVMSECEFHISEREAGKSKLQTDAEDTAEAKGAAAAQTPSDAERTGKIIKFKFFEKNGKIEDSDGVSYIFDLSDVTDISLQSRLLKTDKLLAQIPVKFRTTRRYGIDYAENIRAYSQLIDTSSGTQVANNIKVAKTPEAD